MCKRAGVLCSCVSACEWGSERESRSARACPVHRCVGVCTVSELGPLWKHADERSRREPFDFARLAAVNARAPRLCAALAPPIATAKPQGVSPGAESAPAGSSAVTAGAARRA